MTKGDYHAILQLSEPEFWEIAHGRQEKGVPQYFCVSRNGAIRLFPQLDEKRIALLWAMELFDEDTPSLWATELFDEEGVDLRLRDRVHALWRESKTRKVLLKGLSLCQRNKAERSDV